MRLKPGEKAEATRDFCIITSADINFAILLIA